MSAPETEANIQILLCAESARCCSPSHSFSHGHILIVNTAVDKTIETILYVINFVEVPLLFIRSSTEGFFRRACQFCVGAELNNCFTLQVISLPGAGAAPLASSPLEHIVMVLFLIL